MPIQYNTTSRVNLTYRRDDFIITSYLKKHLNVETYMKYFLNYILNHGA